MTKQWLRMSWRGRYCFVRCRTRSNTASCCSVWRRHNNAPVHKLEARANLEQAAELASQLGAPELLARAALGYGDARSWGETGVVDHTLIGLLEDALRSLRSGHHGFRARVQARLAEELYHRPPDERRALIRQAIAAARRARDPAVLAQVL